MQTYTVEISSGNSKIFFRGRNLRTPVKCQGVFEQELASLKSQINANALASTIKKEDEDIKSQVNIVNKKDSDILVEDLYDSSKLGDSILDNLLKEEKEKD